MGRMFPVWEHRVQPDTVQVHQGVGGPDLFVLPFCCGIDIEK